MGLLKIANTLRSSMKKRLQDGFKGSKAERPRMNPTDMKKLKTTFSKAAETPILSGAASAKLDLSKAARPSW